MLKLLLFHHKEHYSEDCYPPPWISGLYVIVWLSKKIAFLEPNVTIAQSDYASSVFQLAFYKSVQSYYRKKAKEEKNLMNFLVNTPKNVKDENNFSFFFFKL